MSWWNLPKMRFQQQEQQWIHAFTVKDFYEFLLGWSQFFGYSGHQEAASFLEKGIPGKGESHQTIVWESSCHLFNTSIEWSFSSSYALKLRNRFHLKKKLQELEEGVRAYERCGELHVLIHHHLYAMITSFVPRSIRSKFTTFLPPKTKRNFKCYTWEVFLIFLLEKSRLFEKFLGHQFHKTWVWFYSEVIGSILPPMEWRHWWIYHISIYIIYIYISTYSMYP